MKQIYSYLRSAKAFPSRLERRQVSVETAVPGRTNSSDRSSPSPLNYLSASSFVDRTLIARSLSPELIRSASETLPGKSVRKKRRRRRIGTGRATRRTFSSISFVAESFRGKHRPRLSFPMIRYRATWRTLDRSLSCFPFPDSDEQPIWIGLIDLECRLVSFTG